MPSGLRTSAGKVGKSCGDGSGETERKIPRSSEDPRTCGDVSAPFLSFSRTSLILSKLSIEPERIPCFNSADKEVGREANGSQPRFTELRLVGLELEPRHSDFRDWMKNYLLWHCHHLEVFAGE